MLDTLTEINFFLMSLIMLLITLGAACFFAKWWWDYRGRR
jgi:hypothetical protein